MSKSEKKDLSWSDSKRLLSYVFPYRGRLVVGIICGMVFGGSTLGLLVKAQDVMESYSQEHLSLKVMLLSVIGLPIIAAIRGLGQFLGKYLTEWVGMRVIMDIRSQMFSHILDLPMSFFSKSRVGELISRISSDTVMLKELVVDTLGDLIMQPFSLIASVVFIFSTNWKLALVVLIVFPVCVLPLSIMGRKMRRVSRSNQEKLADLTSLVQESFFGVLILKAFRMEPHHKNRFDSYNDQVFRRITKMVRIRAFLSPLMEVLAAVGFAFVLVYAYVKEMELSELVAFGMAAGLMYKPIRDLGKIHLRIQRAAGGVERIFEILNTENTVCDRTGAVEYVETVRQIQFDNVSFCYDEQPILAGVSLDIKAGQCIAFVGSSGAGKTTLVNLIPRFYDVTGGSILLNGKDIRDYTIDSLRKQIGVVTQETVLFNQTIVENIAYGDPSADHEKIVAAAKRANADEFIQRQDAGYDTVIGERGTMLSGGQAQRVAIARALLKNPPILILDEATSALDTESEQLVQGALDELMKERTVFVIAHRLSTIQHADLIVVLDEGKIVEQGTHDELLALGGKYKYFYNIQFKETAAS
ncbi:MAG: ATP-binding cassette domain-containing protein [Kiritimatiellales bacterium]|nr:ATP-binding cassette domain-containing protein [Kiritimatiellales bacterium]